MDDFLLMYDFTDRGGNAVYKVYRMVHDTAGIKEVGVMRLAFEDQSVVSFEWDQDEPDT